MSGDTYTNLILLATFSPIVIFGLVSLLSKPQIQLNASFEDEYMLAGRSIKSSGFINSTTSYMLQVSTTFYFIYWGYNYGLSNIFYLISWAVGIYLFSIFSEKLLNFRANYKSLPEYLSNNKFNFSRNLIGIATIISFIGVFYVESYFTTNFITNISTINSSQNNDLIWWVIFSSLTILILLYSISGGLRKVILTDTWQLASAYIGLAIVFSYLLKITFITDQNTGFILSLICLIIYCSLLIAGRNTNEGSIKTGALIFGILLFLYLIVNETTFSLLSFSTININGIFKQVSEPWGWVTLLGFTIINIAWQFCDSSNFQRIGSLSLPKDTLLAKKELKKVIKKLIYVSPLTWGLGIIFGMLIKSATISVSIPGTEYEALIEILKTDALSGNIMAISVLFALILSFVSIMMSTCDSALLAAIQVAHKDLQNKLQLSKTFILITSLIFIMLVSLIAFIHKFTGDASILTVMAGVYSAILVLLPITISKFLNWQISQKQIVAAIILGLIANFYATFLAPSSLPFNVKIVLPIFAGLGCSILGYLIFNPNLTNIFRKQS